MAFFLPRCRPPRCNANPFVWCGQNNKPTNQKPTHVHQKTPITFRKHQVIVFMATWAINKFAYPYSTALIGIAL